MYKYKCNNCKIQITLDYIPKWCIRCLSKHIEEVLTGADLIRHQIDQDIQIIKDYAAKIKIK